MPKARYVRPTLDKVREAIFDILNRSVAGRRVLDLYAGSGSLGIEAISRGAKIAIFIDNSPTCIKTIRENLENLGFKEKGKAIRLDAGKALRYLEQRRERFDLVFIDPPYGEARKSLRQVVSFDILLPYCVVVVEHYKKEVLPKKVVSLGLRKEARYGDTCLAFYQMKPRLTERSERKSDS